MRKIQLLAAALAVSVAPAALAAQSGAAPKPTTAAPVPAKPADAAKVDPAKAAHVQRAALILRTFNLALESKQVTPPVKGALLACLYNNKLSEITAAADRALADNAKPDATAVYHAAAGACGITFTPAVTPPPAAGATPKP